MLIDAFECFWGDRCCEFLDFFSVRGFEWFQMFGVSCWVGAFYFFILYGIVQRMSVQYLLRTNNAIFMFASWMDPFCSGVGVCGTLT